MDLATEKVENLIHHFGRMDIASLHAVIDNERVLVSPSGGPLQVMNFKGDVLSETDELFAGGMRNFVTNSWFWPSAGELPYSTSKLLQSVSRPSTRACLTYLAGGPIDHYVTLVLPESEQGHRVAHV